MSSPMHIVVFIKQVADNTRLKFVDGQPVAESATFIMNPFDEYALETAIRLKEAASTTEPAQLTAITIGPASAKEMLKKAVAVGVDQAFIIQDDLLTGLDSTAISAVMAAAVQTLVPDYSVLLFGQATLDDASAQTGPRVAERLDIASLTYVKEAGLSGESLTATRETENGLDQYELQLPAALCTIKCDYELRGSNIKGVMKANKTEIPLKTLADLNLSADSLKSATTVVRSWQRPARTAGQVLSGVDNQAAVNSLVEFLQTRQLV